MIRAFPSCVINAFVVKNAAWPDADRIQFLNFHHFSKRKRKRKDITWKGRQTRGEEEKIKRRSFVRSVSSFFPFFFFLSFFSVPLTDSSPSCIPYNASINCPGFYRWIHFFFLSFSLFFFRENRTEYLLFYIPHDEHECQTKNRVTRRLQHRI